MSRTRNFKSFKVLSNALPSLFCSISSVQVQEILQKEKEERTEAENQQKELPYLHSHLRKFVLEHAPRSSQTDTVPSSSSAQSDDVDDDEGTSPSPSSLPFSTLDFYADHSAALAASASLRLRPPSSHLADAARPLVQRVQCVVRGLWRWLRLGERPSSAHADVTARETPTEAEAETQPPPPSTPVRLRVSERQRRRRATRRRGLSLLF